MAVSTATLEGPETRAAAERAVQRIKEGIERAEHLREDVIARTKLQPAAALAVAFGVGITLGAVLGWSWRRPATSAQQS